MGLIWDLKGEGRLTKAEEDNAALEERVARIEEDLVRTNRTLIRLLEALEDKFGEDLDGDGRIGTRAPRVL